MQVMPHLEFIDFYYRGFVLLDITHEHLQAEWWVVNRVDSPRYDSACMKALRLKRGEYRYIESQPVKPATSSIELADFSEDLSYLRNWSAGDERAATDMIAALHSGN